MKSTSLGCDSERREGGRQQVASARPGAWCLILAVLAICVCAGDVAAADPPGAITSRSGEAAPASPRIAFVHLRFTGDAVQLVDFKVVPGRFKPAPEPSGERILLQVVSSSGKPLWQGWINDPRTRIVESEAHDRGGRLAGKVITVANPEVTVRVPFFEEGQSIRVSRISPVKGADLNPTELGAVQLREH